AVTDAEDETAVGGEAGDGAHHRREAGDGAAAQVVTVRESAGKHDRVDGRQLLVRVPDERRFGAEQAERAHRVPVVVRAREGDDGDARPGEVGGHGEISIWKVSISGFASSCSHIRSTSALAAVASWAASSSSTRRPIRASATSKP